MSGREIFLHMIMDGWRMLKSCLERTGGFAGCFLFFRHPFPRMVRTMLLFRLPIMGQALVTSVSVLLQTQRASHRCIGGEYTDSHTWLPSSFTLAVVVYLCTCIRVVSLTAWQCVYVGEPKVNFTIIRHFLVFMDTWDRYVHKGWVMACNEN